MLRIVVVRLALVYRRHRHHRLQRVHVGGRHHVQLLVAHQPVLGECDQVVLPHPARIDLDAEVVAQFRGKQMREPGGLVNALVADEHQHRLVHLVIIDPTRHHRHEPLLQVLVEEHLLLRAALDHHRHRQSEDMILTVPGRQAVQVVEEGMERLDVAGVDDLFKTALPCGLDILESRQQGIAQAVAHRLEVVADERRQLAVLAEGVLCRQSGLHPVLHRVPPQVDVVTQERLDLLRRGVLLLPRHLVFPFPS